jgi:hypothetical protein
MRRDDAIGISYQAFPGRTSSVCDIGWFMPTLTSTWTCCGGRYKMIFRRSQDNWSVYWEVLEEAELQHVRR